MDRELLAEVTEELSLKVSLTSGSHWARTTEGETRRRGEREIRKTNKE